jgi:alanine racemase
MGAGESNLSATRPTWAEVNLHNLEHNFRVTREALGPGVAIMPTVKADAYGHGARECARALERAGADWFGVALVEEGLELREAGISRPVLCLGGGWAGQEQVMVEQRLTPVVFQLDALARLDEAARAAGRAVDYHLKVDTGMGRLGVPFAELKDFLDGAKRFENARLDGAMTHFASADDPGKSDFTRRQMDLFQDALGMLAERGYSPTWVHEANSAASTAYPESRANMVRLGGVTYGVWRDATDPTVAPLDWRPVMSVHTRVLLLKTVPAGVPIGYGNTFVTARESRIATLPIGYRDGLRRKLSNLGRVIVRGEFAPIVGRISMDLTIIDVTDVAGVEVGDEVIVIGRQLGREITAEDIAAQLETISYEVTCGISERVPRVYLPAGTP